MSSVKKSYADLIDDIILTEGKLESLYRKWFEELLEAKKKRVYPFVCNEAISKVKTIAWLTPIHVNNI